LNKKEIVKAVSERAEVTAKDAERVIDALFDEVSDQLVAGEKVVLSNFGTFEVRDRKAREGRNPSTGETIHIDAQKTPAFKAGKQLKDRLR
jgi:DNA-binding protein HU-beta